MEPFEETDVIVINGTDEDMELMKTNMEIRQTKQKDKKKNKNKGEAKLNTVEVQNEKKTVVGETSKIVDLPQPNGCSSSSTISKIVEKSKLNIKTIDAAKMKPTKRPANSSSMQDPVYKKTKDDYSVAQDPKATSVFKSIFTSHHSEKEQKRAHWITYNPFYN